MRPRTKRHVRVIAAAVLLSAVLSAVLARREWTAATLALGAIVGALCAGVLAPLEFFLSSPAATALRRLPLLVLVALRTAVYGIVFVVAIVMLGDVMNATARIAEQCRATGEDVIASSAVIAALALPLGVVARSLGIAALRGKTDPIELFALTRAPPPQA